MESTTSRGIDSPSKWAETGVLPDWIGDLSHLELFPSVIMADHATELRQYFRIGGIEAFGKSTVAGMLARAELFSSGTRPCLRCGGHIPLNDDDQTPERGGCGFVPSGSKRCREITQKQAEFLALLDIPTESIPLAADTPCPDCGCHGWVVTGRHAAVPITARPTGSSVKREPSADGLDIDLQILAVCGRRLDRADLVLPVASTTLSGYLEPGSHGLLSLWALVPAGKTWLRQNRLGTQPTAYFAAARIAQEKNHDPKVDNVIRACDDQAAKLLRAAGCAWNAAVAVESKESA
jgi:hypothetical protein